MSTPIKNKPTLEELQGFIDSRKSLTKIAKEQGFAYKTLLNWLCKAGLKKYPGYKCRCGENNPENFSKQHHSECKKCRSKRQIALYYRYKQQSVEYKGGKCVICGYNKCLASMDFHHVDPTQKDPDWRKMCKRAFNTIKEELDKCILLCANCHRETHFVEEE